MSERPPWWNRPEFALRRDDAAAENSLPMRLRVCHQCLMELRRRRDTKKDAESEQAPELELMRQWSFVDEGCHPTPDPWIRRLAEVGLRSLLRAAITHQAEAALTEILLSELDDNRPAQVRKAAQGPSSSSSSRLIDMADPKMATRLGLDPDLNELFNDEAIAVYDGLLKSLPGRFALFTTTELKGSQRRAIEHSVRSSLTYAQGGRSSGARTAETTSRNPTSWLDCISAWDWYQRNAAQKFMLLPATPVVEQQQAILAAGLVCFLTTCLPLLAFGHQQQRDEAQLLDLAKDVLFDLALDSDGPTAALRLFFADAFPLGSIPVLTRITWFFLPPPELRGFVAVVTKNGNVSADRCTPRRLLEPQLTASAKRCSVALSSGLFRRMPVPLEGALYPVELEVGRSLLRAKYPPASVSVGSKRSRDAQ